MTIDLPKRDISEGDDYIDVISPDREITTFAGVLTAEMLQDHFESLRPITNHLMLTGVWRNVKNA